MANAAQTSKGAAEIVALAGGMSPLTSRQIAAVPGADVACLELDLPSGVRGQHREDVARRQLRDSFGLDGETVQIRPIHDPRNADRWTRLLVTEDSLVEGWRAGPAADALAVLPDYLTLPTAEDIWTVGPGAGGLAVRLGPFDGFGATADLVPILLEQALQEHDSKPRALLRLGPPLPGVEQVAAVHDIALETDPSAVGARTLAYGEVGFDLRRDPQLARARLAERVLPWRWPVAVGLLAAILWGTSQVVLTERITNETRDLRRQTQTLVQEHFVPNAPILDVRVQVSQAMSEARAEAQGWGARADPLGLFAQSSQVLFAAKARVSEATYTGADGLQVLVTMPDFAAIERLVDSLEAASLTVDLQDMRTGDTDPGVRASLAITPAPETPSEDQ